MSKRSVAMAGCIALALSSGIAAAQEGRLTVELNKVETGEAGACRAFFLFRNLTDATLSGFEMSLAILDTGGVIDRLLTIDAAPLPTGRTTLKLFEIPETGCENISEILLHDIGVCTVDQGEAPDCFGMIDLLSRAPVALVK